jgi:glycosyltransferase involved in cell wall biosynthesis
MTSMKVSVVVPVYNGADTLPMLAEELAHVLPSVAERYELVLVNDGSPDDSWQVIERLAARYAWIRGVELTTYRTPLKRFLNSCRNSKKVTTWCMA